MGVGRGEEKGRRKGGAAAVTNMPRSDPNLTSPQSPMNGAQRRRVRFHGCLIGAAKVLLVFAAAFGAGLSYAIWQRQAYNAELDAIHEALGAWNMRCPPNVAQVKWDAACQTVQIAVSIVLSRYRPAVSLNEARRLRAEVEERSKGPITADTLEWLLMRLAQTGPQGAEWIQYAEPQWKESLDRMRTGGKSTRERPFVKRRGIS